MFNLSFSKKAAWLVALPALASASLLVSTSLIAAGVINPWTTADKKSYIDETYLGAGAIVDAFPVEAGSSAGSETEKKLEVRVLLPAGAGSLTEDTRYVGTTSTETALPEVVTLKAADANWQPTSSKIEGNLDLSTWDKDSLQGKLFGYKIEALPISTGE